MTTDPRVLGGTLAQSVACTHRKERSCRQSSCLAQYYVKKSFSLFEISCFKKSKLLVTGEKWALNTCTGKLTSGDLPRKSVVK